jgi:hypothetical protein
MTVVLNDELGKKLQVFLVNNEVNLTGLLGKVIKQCFKQGSQIIYLADQSGDLGNLDKVAQILGYEGKLYTGELTTTTRAGRTQDEYYRDMIDNGDFMVEEFTDFPAGRAKAEAKVARLREINRELADKNLTTEKYDALIKEKETLMGTEAKEESRPKFVKRTSARDRAYIEVEYIDDLVKNCLRAKGFNDDHIRAVGVLVRASMDMHKENIKYLKDFRTAITHQSVIEMLLCLEDMII